MKFRKYWSDLEAADTVTVDRVNQDALKKAIEYVWSHSTFYQNKFAAEGVTRDKVITLENLSELPFTEKYELRESQARRRPLGDYQACPDEDIVRIYSSSGTTGVPTYIGGTSSDYELASDATARCLWSQGLRPDDVCVSTVGPPFAAGSIHAVIEKIGAMHVPIGWDTERVLAAFMHLGANSVVSTPSYASCLAEQCEKRGISGKDLGLRKILVGGEPGGSDPALRARVEQFFDAKMTECKGIGEAISLTWAECDHQQGMHYLGQGTMIVELIDPETGEVIPFTNGAVGELVYTTLIRECMPLVRYRTRDHVMIFTEDCACGRTSPRIKCLGRTDDMLIVLGVNVYPSAIRDVVGHHRPRVNGAVEVQLMEQPPSVTPPLQLKVEYTDEAGDLGELQATLEKALHDQLLARTKVELVPANSLPRFEYKSRLVRKVYAGE